MEKKWGRKLHVASSLPSKKGQFALFLGRWQPLHAGHKEMFERALEDGKNLLVLVRESPVDENNPFTTDQVRENIEKTYESLVNCGKMIVQIVPDICSVEFGRGVGYDIIEHLPPAEVRNISATDIRKKLRDRDAGKL